MAVDSQAALTEAHSTTHQSSSRLFEAAYHPTVDSTKIEAFQGLKRAYPDDGTVSSPSGTGGTDTGPRMDLQLMVLQCPKHKVHDVWFAFSGDIDHLSEEQQSQLYGQEAPEWWYDEIPEAAKELLKTISHLQTLQSGGYLSEDKRSELQKEAITLIEDHPPGSVRQTIENALLENGHVRWKTEWQTHGMEAFHEDMTGRFQRSWEGYPGCVDAERHQAQVNAQPSAEELLQLYKDVQKRSEDDPDHDVYIDLRGNFKELSSLQKASDGLRREVAKEVASVLESRNMTLEPFPESLLPSKLTLFHEIDEEP